MIVRTPRRERYAIIDKHALEDSRLSWKARGLLAYLLSKPDSWRVIIAQLVKEGPDGRAAVMAGLQELESAGYIVRHGRRTDSGRFDGVDCEVHESPQSDFPTAVFPTAENRHLVNNDLSEEMTSVNASPSAPQLALVGQPTTKSDPLEGFDEFWGAYPRRNGKRVGRGATEVQWRKLSLADRRDALRGAQHLTAAVEADLTLPKDPERFLKGRCWRDWQEPAQPRRRDGRRRGQRPLEDVIESSQRRRHPAGRAPLPIPGGAS